MIALAAAPVSNDVLIFVGPVILALAIIGCVVMTTLLARKKSRPARGTDPGTDPGTERGAVQGGVIKGDPGQRNRRDQAPRES